MESHWGGAKFSILECFLIHLVLWLRNKIAPAAGPVSSVTLVLPEHVAPAPELGP